ncbi:Unknown protein, partial [Striga hermonthica]
ILDTGATDHMVCDASFFTSLKPDDDVKINLPNGNTTNACAIGQINLSSHLVLHNALYVSNFSFNLIFVSKLVSTTNCMIQFLSSHCILQDLTTLKMIGSVDLTDGLYHLTFLDSNHTSCIS